MVKAIFLKHKALIITLMVVLAIALTLYIVGRRAGKRKAIEDNPNLAPLPDDSSGTINAERVRGVANALFADLDKWNYNPVIIRDDKAYSDFLSLGDREFVAVSNDFNSRFSAEFDGQSLRVIIRNTNFWGNSTLNAYRDSLEERFSRLNII